MNKASHKNDRHSPDMIITPESFGILRKALIEFLGKEKAKKFLMGFGKELGEKKAKELLEGNEAAPILEKTQIITDSHIGAGHVSAVLYDVIDPESLNTNAAGFKENNGIWKDSYESKLHLEQFGMADECSCYTLSGYASGSVSVVMGKEVFVKEITCRSKGDSECSFEVNTREYWENNTDEVLPIFDTKTISEELEITYDTLMSQKNLLQTIESFHTQLTSDVIQQNSLDNIVEKAYQILGVPIVIEELDGDIVTILGITETDFKELMGKKKSGSHRHTHFKKIDDIETLSTPIFLDNKPYFTCHFIYSSDRKYSESDYLYLERLSAVSTLCFLNEKVKFETTERLKINILDRLITRQYSSPEEISAQLKYFTQKGLENYITLVFEPISYNSDDYNFDLEERIFRISNILKKNAIDGLLSRHDKNIVVLIYNHQYPIPRFKLENIITDMEESGDAHYYKLGISNEFEGLGQFHESLKEAEQAARLSYRNTIQYYDELGILSTFLSGIDSEELLNTAKRQLGDLLEPDERYRELLNTLYTYLINGGKLEKTVQDLSLSIGGIQYRIRKIEKIIGTDLKDYKNTSYLLLLIESLIATGRLKL